MSKSKIVKHPLECRQCQSHDFFAEVEGAVFGAIVLTVPDIEDLDENWDQEECTGGPFVDDTRWDEPGQWKCVKCHSEDIISIEEVQQTRIQEAKRNKDIEEGRIYFVDENQLDMFTGEVIGRRIERKTDTI